MSVLRVASALLSLSALAVLVGCSAKPESTAAQTAPAAAEAPVEASSGKPGQLTLEERLRTEPVGSRMLMNLTRTAVSNRDFAALDAFEARLRASGETNSYGGPYLEDFHTQVQNWVWRNAASVTVREKFFQDWLQARPQSVVAPLHLARAYYDHAWEHRGTKYANKVTQEQWAGFGEYMDKTMEAMALNGEAQARNPEFYATLLYMATAAGMTPDVYAATLERTLTLAPNYYGAFENIGVYISPQWGGSPELLESLARRAAKQSGARGYALAYVHALGDAKCNCTYTAAQLKWDWSYFAAGMREVLAGSDSTGMPNRFAAIACNFGHPETGNELASILQERGKRPDIWKRYEHSPACTAWMSALDATSLTAEQETERVYRNAAH